MSVADTAKNLMELFFMGGKDESLPVKIQNGIKSGVDTERHLVTAICDIIEDKGLQAYVTPEKIKTLKEWGLNLNLQTNGAPRTILISTALELGPDLINAVLDAGANIDQKNNLGMTALLRTLMVPHIPRENIDCLVERGADLNAVAQNGNNPFAAAFDPDKQAFVRSLVDKGMEPWATNEKGEQRFGVYATVENMDQLRALQEMGLGIRVVNQNGQEVVLSISDKEYPLPLHNSVKATNEAGRQARIDRARDAAKSIEPPPGPGGGAARR